MALVLEGLPCVRSGRSLDSDVEELKVEGAVDIATNDAVCFDNLLDVMLDEVVVRVDVLLDETWDSDVSFCIQQSKWRIITFGGLPTFDFQEGRQELVLVLLGTDWVAELFAIVERLEEGLEAIVLNHRHRVRGPIVCNLAKSLLRLGQI